VFTLQFVATAAGSVVLTVVLQRLPVVRAT
jgi:hypothetical protein